MDQSGFMRQSLQRIKPKSRVAVTTRTQVTMSFFTGIMRVHPNGQFRAELPKRKTVPIHLTGGYIGFKIVGIKARETAAPGRL
jgi:hypothetical protein